MSIILPAGTTFAARYRVVRRIAAGGMGAVYEVIHVETERRHALKVMLPHLVESAALRERFRREAKLVAGLDTEHVIEVLDAGVDDATGLPFMVMELLHGEDLSARIKRGGAVPPDAALVLLRQTALALDEIHRASIVHRDLKPQNLFLVQGRDRAMRVKVLDFGIAKALADPAVSAQPTEFMGTPFYMAPEQFRIDGRITRATDIYALGMLAYTMLVGAPYWREESGSGRNVYAFLGVVLHGPLEPATTRAARAGMSLSSAFDLWFTRATARRPEHRFQSATAAIDALAAVLLGGEVQATLAPESSATAKEPAAMLPVRPLTVQGTSGSLLPAIGIVDGATRVRGLGRSWWPLVAIATVIGAVVVITVRATGRPKSPAAWGAVSEDRASSSAPTSPAPRAGGAPPVCSAPTACSSAGAVPTVASAVPLRPPSLPAAPDPQRSSKRVAVPRPATEAAPRDPPDAHRDPPSQPAGRKEDVYQRM